MHSDIDQAAARQVGVVGDLPDVAVQQLRPAISLRPKTPQCEAQRIHDYYSDRFKPVAEQRPRQCQHSASYVIAGRYYCKHHAGDVALQMLLDHAAQRSPAPPPRP